MVALRQPGPAALGERFDLVLLAIKPQMWSQSADAIARFAQSALVPSIMAGIRTATLRAKLRTDRVVRAMPNLAAEIGDSMTVGFAAPELMSQEDRILATELFTCIGRMEWLPS